MEKTRPVHICYIAGTKIPSLKANSIQVMKMCQAMVELHHHVTLIIPDFISDPTKLPVSIWQHYGIQGNFPIKTLNPPLIRKPYHSIPKPFRVNIFSWQAVSLSQRLQADVIYTRYLPVAVLSSAKGIPTIYELHEMPNRINSIYLYVLIKSPGFKHFVVITEGLKQELIEKHPAIFKNEKIILAPDGVDIERFADLPTDVRLAQRKIGLEDVSGLVAGYVGHFYKGKGTDFLIELAKCCPNITFLMVGGEPEDVNFYLERLRQDDITNVHLTGFVPNSVVPMYLAACNILLLPNQLAKDNSVMAKNFSSWTSPMKLFEYMATGKPIAVSNLAVLREVVNDKNSILCTPGDLQEWKNILVEMTNNKDIYQARAMQAQIDVLQYTWHNRVRKCLTGLN